MTAPHDDEGAVGEIGLGELGRMLGRLEVGMAEHGHKLDIIQEQTLRTNGRVNAHDMRLEKLESAMSRAMWTGIGLNVSIAAGVIVWWATQH